MGTQTQDSVLVEAAERAKKAKEQGDEGAAAGRDAAASKQPVARAVQELRAHGKVAVDMAAAYASERPLEALLIAGAAGALLMGVVMLVSKGD